MKFRYEGFENSDKNNEGVRETEFSESEKLQLKRGLATAIAELRGVKTAENGKEYSVLNERVRRRQGIYESLEGKYINEGEDRNDVPSRKERRLSINDIALLHKIKKRFDQEEMKRIFELLMHTTQASELATETYSDTARLLNELYDLIFPDKTKPGSYLLKKRELVNTLKNIIKYYTYENF